MVRTPVSPLEVSWLLLKSNRVGPFPAPMTVGDPLHALTIPMVCNEPGCKRQGFIHEGLPDGYWCKEHARMKLSPTPEITEYPLDSEGNYPEDPEVTGREYPPPQ